MFSAPSLLLCNHFKRCLRKSLIFRTHSSMTFSCMLYYRRQHFVKNHPNLLLQSQKFKFSSTTFKLCQSKDDHHSSNSENSVELNEEFKSYIEEMRMEFGASNPEQELDSELKIDNDKDPDNKKAGPRSVQDKYTSYDDDVVEVILDESEVYEILDRGEESFYLQEDKTDVYSDIILQRGTTGVFDLPEFVDVLHNENVYDICVINVPEERNYADHIIITSCKSARHSAAVAQFIRKLHKRKKHVRDPYLKIEGENCPDWKAIDLGNIVLHLFLPETREKYDLETLWSVGEQYDDLSHQAEDPMLEAIMKHTVYLQDMQPIAVADK